MMPVLAVNKAAISLAAIFEIAVLAGCSSPSPGSSPATGTHLTGTISDWTSAVCERSPQPFPNGRYMAGATSPTECFATMPKANGGRMGPVPILIGTYTSEASLNTDLGRLGALCERK